MSLLEKIGVVTVPGWGKEFPISRLKHRLQGVGAFRPARGTEVYIESVEGPNLGPFNFTRYRGTHTNVRLLEAVEELEVFSTVTTTFSVIYHCFILPFSEGDNVGLLEHTYNDVREVGRCWQRKEISDADESALTQGPRSWFAVQDPKGNMIMVSLEHYTKNSLRILGVDFWRREYSDVPHCSADVFGLGAHNQILIPSSADK